MIPPPEDSEIRRPVALKTTGLSERLDPVYIGHLPKDLTDDLLKKILTECGVVVKIVRSRTPKTDELASFGLVELDNVESVWKVINMINDLEVIGSKLVVKCPAKTREMVDRWHNNRSYHLYKNNPSWSQEQIDAEFLAAEEPLRESIRSTVKAVEEAVAKAKAEKEADDKARASRLELMRQRLIERKAESEEQAASKRQRMEERKKEKTAPDSSLPSELVARQKHRVDAYLRKKQDFLKHLEEAKQNWPKTLDGLRKKAERREEDIIYRWSKAIPSAREAWNQLKADLEGYSAVLTVSYACSNGTSPLYDLEPKLASEASRLSTDCHDIPTARYWTHKVNSAREGMRRSEREDELSKEGERLKEDELSKKDERLKEESVDQPSPEEDELPDKPSQEHQPSSQGNQSGKEFLFSEIGNGDSPSGASGDAARLAAIKAHMQKVDQAADSEIDWARLSRTGLFVEGELRAWLVERTTEFVGAEDAEDMAEFILDQFPPRADQPPTEESLATEMREFLDVETDQFVKALWTRIKQC
ncbi:RNA recognition motif protein [Gregarina niphandrodes]|uniref:RNA recognition motif protein n=1 Tax=Gregarina niphandrodes TaxID=110365 RepID=A0A023AYW6_GRENI|nr:RNA recognition motif protein [Gregarina niphandrodes]EZG43851.1 RNA recognition motif protein [Gregarina niphandrodes]|eukprot:XP_011132972.1 RNA recognition motif protein [Gregarina niphandrodes]